MHSVFINTYDDDDGTGNENSRKEFALVDILCQTQTKTKKTFSKYTTPLATTYWIVKMNVKKKTIWQTTLIRDNTFTSTMRFISTN